MATPSAASRARSIPDSLLNCVFTVSAAIVNRRTAGRIRTMTATSTSTPATSNAMLTMYATTTYLP